VIVDPKLAAASVLYLPANFEAPADVQEMQKRCNVQVKHLPQVIHKLGEVDTSNLEPPGLLYLNNKYVVPGGRFNEMYGWDSYFHRSWLGGGPEDRTGAGGWWRIFSLRSSTTERC